VVRPRVTKGGGVSKTIGWMLLLLFLSACATTQPVPEDRFYRLERIQPQHTLAEPVLYGGLAVDYVQADPLRSGRAVIYSDRDHPLQLQRYHYEFWVDQPPRLLHQALLSYLRDSGVADTVIDTTVPATVDYRLRLRLLKFEQVLERQSADVEVALQATLSSGPAEEVLWTRTYTQRQSSGSLRIDAAASAMQVALGELFAALQADLAASPTRKP
jgi:ABC-type uncharacterized transport system auxiliary subunit